MAELKDIQRSLTSAGITLNIIDQGIGITDEKGNDVLALAVQQNLSYLTKKLLDTDIGDAQTALDSRPVLDRLTYWWKDVEYKLTYNDITKLLEEKIRQKASKTEYCKTSSRPPRHDIAAMYCPKEEPHRHTD